MKFFEVINIENNEREVLYNRDIKVKISLINHVQYFFNLQGIDEKAIQLLPTELIDKNYSNLRMDFLGNVYPEISIILKGKQNL